MTGTVPKDLVEEVRRRADLVVRAQAATKLRKQGTRWVGLCPFHEETNPSFTVFSASGDKPQRFRCFGCGVHGDVIDFVMKTLGRAFRDAVRDLAQELGVPILK